MSLLVMKGRKSSAVASWLVVGAVGSWVLDRDAGGAMQFYYEPQDRTASTMCNRGRPGVNLLELAMLGYNPDVGVFQILNFSVWSINIIDPLFSGLLVPSPIDSLHVYSEYRYRYSIYRY